MDKTEKLEKLQQLLVELEAQTQPHQVQLVYQTSRVLQEVSLKPQAENLMIEVLGKHSKPNRLETMKSTIREIYAQVESGEL